MSNELKFKCPKCGYTKLQEVLLDATVTSTVIFFDGDPEPDYPERPEIDDGFVDRYECAKCGFALPGPNDDYITNPEEAAKWLKENCEQ